MKKQEQGEGRVEGKGGEERGRGGGGGGGRGMVGESKYGCPGHKTSPAARGQIFALSQKQIQFPPTNKYGWCRLLNCRATPEAGASWSQDLEIILRNWTRATLQASRKF